MPNFLSNGNINNSSNTPRVKSSNNTEAPKTILLKGWLMKQKNGKAKTWLKRYFVLHGDELRYYKTKTDNNTLAVISLEHYSLVPNAESMFSTDKKNRLNTFCLISDDETKYNWPDYFLQVNSDEERQIWINHIQRHVAQSKSILDKWLERLDLPVENISVLPSTYSNGPNSNKSEPYISTEPKQMFRLQNKKNASSSTLPSSPPCKKTRHFGKSLEKITSYETYRCDKELPNIIYDKELPGTHYDKELPETPTEPLSPTKSISSKIFFWNRSKNFDSCESFEGPDIDKKLPPTPVVAVIASESRIMDPREFENEERFFHLIKNNHSQQAVTCLNA